jgi:hypothetical protein
MFVLQQTLGSVQRLQRGKLKKETKKMAKITNNTPTEIKWSQEIVTGFNITGNKLIEGLGNIDIKTVNRKITSETDLTPILESGAEVLTEGWVYKSLVSEALAENLEFNGVTAQQVMAWLTDFADAKITQ